MAERPVGKRLRDSTRWLRQPRKGPVAIEAAKRFRPPRLNALGMALALCLTSLPAAADSHALLIGVSRYRFSEGKPIERSIDLEGPQFDVRALAALLQSRWQVPAANITTLENEQATRDAVLRAIDALETRAAPGDTVLIYFSGHGTSALDSTLSLPVPDGSGAFAPHDYDPERGIATLVVGRTDLRPRLARLETQDRHVWVVADACYSGRLVRSQVVEDALPSRYLPRPPRSTRDNMRRAAPAEALPDEPYPYQRTRFLSASAEGEIAVDLDRRVLARYPTRDGQPHGALTDALLRVLAGELPADSDRSGTLSLEEAHRALGAFLAGRGIAQSPQKLPALAEDRAGLAQAPVLAARGVAAVPGTPPTMPLVLELQAGLPASLMSSVSSLSGVAVGGGEPDLLVLNRAGRFELRTGSRDLIARVEHVPQLIAQLRQLAWVHRLRQSARRHQRTPLAAEITPARFGGNFSFGQTLAFVVKPERDAFLLLVNIDARGEASVLYPASAAETGALAGGEARHIPGTAPRDRIRVQAPEGLDVQLLFAFDEAPALLAQLTGLAGASADDARLAALEALLPEIEGRYSFASLELRSLPASR